MSIAARGPETQACRESWTAGRDALEGLVAAFTIESGQPAVAETKLKGLLGSYGFEEGPATEYFSLHAELDHEHAAQARELIDERLADADLERLLAIAEGALRGQLGAAGRRRAPLRPLARPGHAATWPWHAGCSPDSVAGRPPAGGPSSHQFPDSSRRRECVSS